MEDYTYPDAQLHFLSVDIHLMYLVCSPNFVRTLIHKHTSANTKCKEMSLRMSPSHHLNLNTKDTRGRMHAHPKVHPNRRARLVLRDPLLVREPEQQAALPDRRVSNQQ